MFRGGLDSRGRHQDSTDVSDQLPYGDFAPDRYAWLLEDVKPTTGRCPTCWGSGGVQHGIHYPDTACSICDGKGVCEPVPAKGRQGLWKWTP